MPEGILFYLWCLLFFGEAALFFIGFWCNRAVVKNSNDLNEGCCHMYYS